LRIITSKVKPLIIDALLIKTMKISLITISMVLLTMNAPIFNAHAQTGGAATGGATTGGAATGGATTGGAATGGAFMGGTCDHCSFTVEVAPRGGAATGGSTTGGSANGGATTGGAATGGPPTAMIRFIYTDQNVWLNGLKGMNVHISFNVQGLQGKNGQVVVYFYYSEGQPLFASYYSQYKTQNNHVAAFKGFVPRFQSSDYNDFQLFMPYSGLNMKPGGASHLRFHVLVFDDTTVPAQALWTSTWHYLNYYSPPVFASLR
jgi:hypothetical protein